MLKAFHVALIVGGVVFGAAQPMAADKTESGSVDVVRPFTGFWKAPEYKVTVSSDLDYQVWGRGASKVRNVELAIEPSGEGILRLRNAVVDARGRTKPYSASMIEARIALHPGDPMPGDTALRPVVKVLSAEERYLDGTGERRQLDGVTVSLHMMSPDSRELNVRWDTPQGTGSFGETLIRRGRSASVAAANKTAARSNRS